MKATPVCSRSRLAAARFVLGAAGRGRLLVVGALMLALAMSEGIGILMLVPLLNRLNGAGAGHMVRAGFLDLGLGQLLGLFVGLVAARAVLQYVHAVRSIRMQLELADALRDRLLRAILSANWRASAAMRQSDNLYRIVSRIDELGFGANRLLALTAASLALVSLALAALAISPELALAGAAAGTAVLAAFGGMRGKARLLGQALGRKYEAILGHLGENLQNLRLVKMSGRAGITADRSASEFAALREHRVDVDRLTMLGHGLLQTGGALGVALLIWLAAVWWKTPVAMLLPLILLLARAVPLLGTAMEAWQSWALCVPAAEETSALLSQLEAEAEPELLAPAPPLAIGDGITLDQVEVSFPGRTDLALSGISLHIPTGSVAAVTGPSGAGKSTLVDLIAGLTEPDRGSVLVGTQVLDPPSRLVWRQSVGYVQQDCVLFNASVRDNLLWAAPEASDEELRAALRQASAGFVLALPHGLDTQVGDRGQMLSGGERQRVALARALLTHPRLLILDEATSALDAASEAQVVEAIARLKGSMTIVVISHRGSLLDLADQEIRLAGGRRA